MLFSDLCMGGSSGVCVHHNTHVEAGGQPMESALSPSLGPRDRTQVVELGSQYLSALSLLSALKTHFLTGSGINHSL